MENNNCVETCDIVTINFVIIHNIFVIHNTFVIITRFVIIIINKQLYGVVYLGIDY
jgi:hypothetical protein